MKEQLTTYRTQGKTNGLCFLFKYDLNGDLRAFEIPDGVLNDEQMTWLYSARFPATEKLMQANWVSNPKATSLFDITVIPPDISFEAWWKAYNLKIKKELAEKAWNKLSTADHIEAFIGLPKYEAYLLFSGQAKAHPVTWLNQKRWRDEYPEAPPVYKKEPMGKVFNNALQDLAKKKTEK